MRSILVLLLLVISLPSFASTCYKQAAFYGCSNSSGTTCTKVAVTALIPDTVTALASCAYLVINSTEQAKYDSDLPVSTFNNQISIVGTRLTNVETRSTNLETRSTNLESRSTALETAYNAMVSTVNSISAASTQSAGAVASITSQLNAPFDLNTALLGTAFFFSTIIFFYGIAKGAGAILTMIRTPLNRRF